jgi:hypothetical protein
LRDLTLARRSEIAATQARLATVEAQLAARTALGERLGQMRLHVIDRYLTLMRDELTGKLRQDRALPMVKDAELAGLSDAERQGQAFDADLRDKGLDWPMTALSMIGTRRMDNLRLCCEMAIARGIPGDFVETGVWRGGACIYMRAILDAHQAPDRAVWVCDSFEGLPPPDVEQFPADEGLYLNEYSGLAISLEEVQDNFRRFGLLDDRVHFVKGFFKDTLHLAPIESISVLRLDGDLYQSTIEALTALYPKVSAGGYVIIDDYGAFEACSRAVHDYLTSVGQNDVRITDIDGIGAWFQKP